MKKRILHVFNFIIMLSIYGCNTGLGKWNIDELYAQQIEGSSKLLYKFDAWGGRDSNANGFVLLDSTEEFRIDLSKKLPFYHLSDSPNKFNISGVTYNCYNSCDKNYYKTDPVFKVMKTENMISNGINVTTRIFQYRGYSEKDYSLERYVFEKFKETKDSLFFYNLNDIESESGIHLNELKLRKGEVYLEEGNESLIKKIIINEVKLNSKNNNIEYIRTIHLTPKYQKRSSEFSRRGIFKPVKIKNKE